MMCMWCDVCMTCIWCIYVCVMWCKYVSCVFNVCIMSIWYMHDVYYVCIYDVYLIYVSCAFDVRMMCMLCMCVWCVCDVSMHDMYVICMHDLSMGDSLTESSSTNELSLYASWSKENIRLYDVTVNLIWRFLKYMSMAEWQQDIRDSSSSGKDTWRHD